MRATVQRAVVRRLCATRSVVVGGHGVGDVRPEHDPENLVTAPDRFRAQVELLLEGGFRLVTVAELVAAGRGGPPPPGLAALSFDDGMENNLSVVAPLLREYDAVATVYVVSGLVGEPNPWMAPEAGARMMTAAELRAIAAGGWEVGAHTVTHPDLATLGESACRHEAAASRAAVAELVGAPVTTFAYPYCRAGGHAVAGVRAAGFTAAVVGPRRGPWAPLEVPRAMVTGVDGLPSFTAKLAGLYEPVFASRAGAAARATTRRPRMLIRRLRRGGASAAS